MVLSKRAGMAPRDLAAAVIERIPENTVISQCDIAGPGFINFHISQASNLEVVKNILELEQALVAQAKVKANAFRLSLYRPTPRASPRWTRPRGRYWGCAVPTLGQRWMVRA